MFLAFRFSYTRYKFQAFMATFLSVTLIGDPRVICLLLVKVFMATFVSVRLTGDPRVICLLLVKVFMATVVSAVR